MSRLWCLYEIWQTIKLGNDRLVLIMNKAESKLIERAVCDISKAETTTAEDKERILADIKAVIAHDELTFTIRKCIKDRINQSSQ